MYLVIAYHGKGKQEVEEDLKKLWFNFSNFVKKAQIKHMYYLQAVKNDKGADLVMIVDYKCLKPCSDTSGCFCMPGAAKQSFNKSKHRDVNYWFYVRDKAQKEALI